MKTYTRRSVIWGCCGSLLTVLLACRKSREASNPEAKDGSVSESSSKAEVADDALVAEPGALVLALNVEGMHCTSCAEGIGKALADLNGVRKARVSFEKRSAWLLVDAQNHVSAEDAARVVSDLGFTAVPKPASAPAEPAS